MVLKKVRRAHGSIETTHMKSHQDANVKLKELYLPSSLYNILDVSKPMGYSS